MYTFRFLLFSDSDSTHSNKIKLSFYPFSPFDFMILTANSFVFGFVYIQLAHKQSRSVPKMSLNANLHDFGRIGNHTCT